MSTKKTIDDFYQKEKEKKEKLEKERMARKLEKLHDNVLGEFNP